jgi:hypothetical protein
MKHLLLIVLLLVGSGVPAANAQGDNDCDPEAVEAWLLGVKEWITVLSQAFSVEENDLGLSNEAFHYVSYRVLFEIGQLERPACADVAMLGVYQDISALSLLRMCPLGASDCRDRTQAALAESDLDTMYDELKEIAGLGSVEIEGSLPEGWDWVEVKAMFPGDTISEQGVVREYGTYTNPVPLGESVEFPEYGVVRLVEVIDPYVTDEVYNLDEGYRLVGFRFEYDCTLATADKPCTGHDFWVDGVMTPDGRLLESEIIFVSDSLPNLNNMEGFAGTTLVGVSFFALPEDETFSHVRVSAMGWSFNEVYFAVTK